jgi:LexA-binding, inner membrane-associated putative hydrolase
VRVYPLGHVGLGMRIVPPRVRSVLPGAWLAFGCLLPDLIDKPVFIAARVARRALPDSFDVWLDVLRGSRLLGHSLFFFGAVLVVARLKRADWSRAVAWGVSTHLVLDLAPDLLASTRLEWPTWLLWPVFGLQLAPGGNWASEAFVYRVGELVGAALIIVEVARRGRVRAPP